MKHAEQPSQLHERISAGLAGTAGEYLVAGELSRRGYIASLTLRNARGIDILVAKEDASHSVGLQVKTSQGSKPVWILSQKVESMGTAKNLVFAFVVLNGLGHPAFHIVPRQVVVDRVRKGHSSWLSAPGKRGQARNDSGVRKFDDRAGEFLDRWDLLGLD